jgi:phage terminase small subunit
MALDGRQRAFVMSYVTCGSGARSARLAGYGKPTSTAGTFSKIAYQLLHNDRVLLAIKEESRKHYHSLHAKAVREAERILDSPTARDVDKLRAADGVLARVDPIQTSQLVQVSHQHDHHIRMSADELTKRILQLASRVGADVAALPPVIVDAVAEEEVV